MPFTSPIFQMFGRSPIKPLEQHMTKAHAAAEALRPFFEAVMAADWEHAEQFQAEISRLEHEADVMKRELRLNLPKGYFLPVARGDILELLSSQDRIANRAKDLAGIVLGRKLLIPPTLREEYMSFLQRCIKATAQATKAINELDELLETGFRGNEVMVVEQMINELDVIEHETDTLQVHLRRELFAIENTLPPVDVIFLYKVIERTGELADCAHRVGGRLLLLLAR